MKLSEIEAARTSAGGWTRETLAGWGVPWPPPKGWKQKLLTETKGKTMTDDLIKHMTNRFLQWKLPEDFHPDAGISFKPDFNEHTNHPMRHEPTGTNLLNFAQAEAMVRHMVEGAPDLAADVIRLVIVAREIAYSDLDGEEWKAARDELDKAAEAFASRVPWENEP